MIAPDPNGRFILVADLGTDQVSVYRLDPAAGKLIPNSSGTPVVKEQPGAGPRHFAFAPDGRALYVINELDLDAVRLSRTTPSAARWTRGRPSPPSPRDSPGVNCVRPRRRLPGRPLRLRLQPGARQHRHLGGRRRRQGNDRRPRVDARQDAARFRPRPERALAAGRQPGLRHDRHVSPRCRDRHADGDRGGHRFTVSGGDPLRRAMSFRQFARPAGGMGCAATARRGTRIGATPSNKPPV